MDSVTQAVLGASIAGALAPAGQRRKALLLGATLGTLPDLDVFIDYGDAVKDFTYHRSFSHSLLILAPFSVLLWLVLRRWWAPARGAPARWLAAVGLVLLTHPLLDAHTAYGTQLFWPLLAPPTMWGTIFVIDPLYTLPLFVATALTAFRPANKWSDGQLRVGLALSTLYLGWSWTAQAVVSGHADEALVSMGLEDAHVFVTPTPFNTLLWRVVVQTDEGYLEGFDSLLVEEVQMQFKDYTSDIDALEAASDVWAVARLRWFASDFVKARVEDSRLLVSDLRMGQEPSYAFTHVAAIRGNARWQETQTEHIPMAIGNRALPETWQRIWSE